MSNYRVCVYAICKDEEAFVDRWMDSMGEADWVVVLDTGSRDGTVNALRRRGARVEQQVITPWRFDTARNRSLELVPQQADICVCTDLDEVFRPGWRQALEQAWTPGAGQACYRYTWSFQPDGSEGYVFWAQKVHARRGYRWVHPVHEVLQWEGEGEPGPMVTAEGVQLDHHPDDAKSRSQYLPLLELAVAEEPENDRNVHYLGREYLFRGRWDDCIRTLKAHLELPGATWADERSASMRYIAQAFARKGEVGQARDWYLRAIAQAPHLREGYVDLAALLYEQGEWDGVLYFTGCALAIRDRPRTYITQAQAWSGLPWDLRSIALYHTGRLEEALEAARQAACLTSWDDRIKGNMRIIEAEMDRRRAEKRA